MDLLDQVERGNLEELDEDLRMRVYITLFQACLRALLRQSNPNSIEETAYHVLVLCEARRLPLFESLAPVVDDKLNTLIFLLENSTESAIESTSNRLWIEKVSYGSRVLTQSYKLAALKAASQPVRASETTFLDAASARPDTSKKFVKLLKQTPLFASTPEWQIQASMTEASLFQPLLRRRRCDVFPRKNMAPDQYFDLIPLTWTSCNNRSTRFVSANFMYEMMVISFLCFQADEFMEAVAGPAFQGNLSSLRRLINDIFEELALDAIGDGNEFQPMDRSKSTSESTVTVVNGVRNAETQNRRKTGLELTEGSLANSSPIAPDQTPEYQEVLNALIRFVYHIAGHRSVRTASAWDQRSTLRELQIYLQAHVTQSEDNQYLVQTRRRGNISRESWPDEKITNKHQPPHSICGSSLKDGYFRWIRDTSGDHTACTYAYAFAGCLISSSMRQRNHQIGRYRSRDQTANRSQCPTDRSVTTEESFPTGCTKYLSAVACQHLAAMCRMYNDYGSVARDAAEDNLNSVDFPELRGSPSRCGQIRSAGDYGLNGDFRNGDLHHRVEENKKTLFALAQYERKWFQDAMERLREEMQALGRKRNMEAWDLFSDVTDLYGQIYMVRDIASSLTNGNGNGKCVAATLNA